MLARAERWKKVTPITEWVALCWSCDSREKRWVSQSGTFVKVANVNKAGTAKMWADVSSEERAQLWLIKREHELAGTPQCSWLYISLLLIGIIILELTCDCYRIDQFPFLWQLCSTWTERAISLSSSWWNFVIATSWVQQAMFYEKLPPTSLNIRNSWWFPAARVGGTECTGKHHSNLLLHCCTFIVAISSYYY